MAEVTLNLSSLQAGMSVSRFSFRETAKLLRVPPALANRPAVVKPDLPFFITAGEAITLFVSAPVCVRVFIGNDA